MTRIDELKQQIADKRQKLEAINTLTGNEKRVKTAEERTNFDTLFTEIEGLEVEVRDLERVEKIKIEAPTIITSERKENNRKYSAAKAIREFSYNGLSGLEREMHDEMKRYNRDVNGLLIPDELIYRTKRTETLANSTGLVPSNVQGLDIIGVPSLYAQMGATVYDNLQSNVKLNFSQSLTADVVSETSALTEKSYTKSSDTLEPNRYGYAINTTQEALAVTSMVNDFIVDADSAIGAAITSKGIATILADTGTTLTGFGSAATAAYLNAKNAGKLKSAVLAPMFRKPLYITGAELYANLEVTSGATQMFTILEDGKISGYPVFNAMSLMTVHDTNKYDLLFGDASRLYVGLFGNAMQVLVNPYTNDLTGGVRLVFSRLGDVSYNPYAFKAIRNAKLY